MKKLITNSLLILLLLAYNYKTIDHCIKLCTNAIVLNDEDYDYEGKDSEKKSDDKNEKKEFLEYAISEKPQNFLGINTCLFTFQQMPLYCSSDYSMAVYPPPDQVAG